jgi:IclR family transcriptional regulator, KDG regulon repressor
MEIIKKAFNILELFLDHGQELSLEDISRLSGLKKPTARRLALTLVECGYLRQPVRRGKYSLGMRFLDFSGNIKMNNNTVRVASPHLIKLREKLNESVTMAIWDGTNTSLCQSFLADHPLKVVPDEGTRLVLHATSVGKAIIAELPDEELPRYLGGRLARFTPNTITNLNDLKKHLIIVREEGVAFDDEEYNVGIRGVGVAVKNGEGNIVASISILGPSVRLTRARLRECAPVVQSCALDISRELGYNGAPFGGPAVSRQPVPARKAAGR